VSKEFSNDLGQPEQVALPQAWDLGPGLIEPSHVRDYPPYPAVYGEEIISARFNPPAEEQQAMAYMHTLLPDVDTELISTKGSTAVVLGDDRIAEEFARFAGVALNDGIRLQDVEIYADRTSGRAVAIDAAYAQQLSPTKENSGVIVCSLMESFSPRGTHLPNPEETIALFEERESLECRQCLPNDYV
jgi:hypothetical protein